MKKRFLLRGSAVNNKPYILVDAILAKQNLGTSLDIASTVVGVGPGFTAGIDVDAVVETKRGHDLGKVILLINLSKRGILS